MVVRGLDFPVGSGSSSVQVPSGSTSVSSKGLPLDTNELAPLSATLKHGKRICCKSFKVISRSSGWPACSKKTFV